jgi:D-alanine transaminase
MARTIFVNGRYLPYADALIHVEDRSVQFADGVYEVCEVRDGHLVDETRHIKRLHRSLAELRIRPPMSTKAIGLILRETIRRNRVVDGMVYLQISRGVARRDFAFPPATTAPSMICFARSVARKAGNAAAEKGISVITMPDIRWRRPDIKSTSLLPNALAKQAAYEKGAKEAWLVDQDGFVTEGSSSNAWIVDEHMNLVTRPAEFGILRGITRSVVIDLANREGLKIVERPFTVEEALAAREAFLTSATANVTPIVRIDGTEIGTGKPGKFALKLRNLFHTEAEISM